MTKRSIHCVGIGGIGISALARYYRAKGYAVTGSDAAASEITRDLNKEGIKISVGHRARLLHVRRRVLPLPAVLIQWNARVLHRAKVA